MKQIYSTLFFLFFMCLSSFAQLDLACDGERYVDDVFTEVLKTNVTYGSNTNVLGFPQNLKMDVYEPVGDTHDQRPVIIVAFGGSFLFGNKETMESYCEQFAKKGYVAATIDYRLGFQGVGEQAVTAAVMRAVSDMKGAIRYFRKDAATDNNFKIHPDYILAGGYSAGAITALHAAYLDADDDIPTETLDIINANGGFEGNTGDTENLSYSSEIFAVYNLSGGLQDKEWLDATETAPLVSYHGTTDGTVPYTSGLANGLAPIDGSSVVHQQAELIGIPNYLKSVDGGGHIDIHTDAFYADDLAEFEMESHIFLQNQMCPDFTITNTIELALEKQPLSVFPNPSNDIIQFDFEKINSTYQVQVFDQLGRLVAAIENQNDVIFSLEKNKIGTGVFFVNVLFEEETVAPIVRRIIFN